MLAARRDEADRVLRDGDPADARRRRGDGHAPGARRAAVGQAVLRVRRPPLAARARRQPVGPERPGQPGAQRRRGSTWSPATSSRCPTSGSTRGSRRGTWPSTARRCRWSTSTSPRSRSSCCCSTRYLHPNGQIPAYEWNFSDVNPPVTRVGGAVRLRARGGDPRRGRPRVPRARVRSAADQLHLVGQPQGPRRPQPVPGRLPRPRQHRRSSTARRRCPAAARSSRRTARRGWRSTASGCCRSRSSSPSTTRPTATWR